MSLQNSENPSSAQGDAESLLSSMLQEFLPSKGDEVNARGILVALEGDNPYQTYIVRGEIREGVFERLRFNDYRVFQSSGFSSEDLPLLQSLSSCIFSELVKLDEPSHLPPSHTLNTSELTKLRDVLESFLRSSLQETIPRAVAAGALKCSSSPECRVSILKGEIRDDVFRTTCFSKKNWSLITSLIKHMSHEIFSMPEVQRDLMGRFYQ